MWLPTPYQEYIHLSRYARYRYEDNRRETWDETVDRYFEFFKEHLKEECDFNLTYKVVEPIKEAVLVQPEKNVAIYKLPKTVVKTLLTDSNNNSSDTSYTVRRQFVATSNSSGIISLSAGSNEVFGSHNEIDYEFAKNSKGAS